MNVRWPKWTLLVHQRAFEESGTRKFYEYLCRCRCESLDAHTVVGLCVPANRLFLLRGQCCDNYDGNVTPMLLAFCRAPAEFAKVGIESERILGEVEYLAGSLHNLPRRTTLYGRLIDSSAGGAERMVEWREHSDSFGHWVYRAEIARDGRSMSGTFHLSVLPRKKGIFQLHCLDPSLAEIAEIGSRLASAELPPGVGGGVGGGGGSSGDSSSIGGGSEGGGSGSGSVVGGAAARWWNATPRQLACVSRASNPWMTCEDHRKTVHPPQTHGLHSTLALISWQASCGCALVQWRAGQACGNR